MYHAFTDQCFPSHRVLQMNHLQGLHSLLDQIMIKSTRRICQVLYHYQSRRLETCSLFSIHKANLDVGTKE